MISRTYPLGSKHMYCPACHQPMSFNMNINLTGGGSINVNCRCGKGRVKMKALKSDTHENIRRVA